MKCSKCGFVLGGSGLDGCYCEPEKEVLQEHLKRKYVNWTSRGKLEPFGDAVYPILLPEGWRMLCDGEGVLRGDRFWPLWDTYKDHDSDADAWKDQALSGVSVYKEGVTFPFIRKVVVE